MEKAHLLHLFRFRDCISSCAKGLAAVAVIFSEGAVFIPKISDQGSRTLWVLDVLIETCSV